MVVAIAFLALPAAARGQAADYVALGDSYAAGTGTTSVYSDLCFDNPPAAYSSLIDPELPGTGVNIACGGAVTDNIDTTAQYDRPPQLSRSEIGASTKYVTLQIGGNDVGFAGIVAQCLAVPDCTSAIDEAEQTAKAELPAKAERVYDAVRAKAPDAQVVVVGYPRLVDPGGCPGTISVAEADRLNRGADTLRDEIRAFAHKHDFAFADPIPAFTGHAACGPDPWLNYLDVVFPNSFHPNRASHSLGYAPVVLDTFRSIPETKIKGKPKAKGKGKRRAVKVKLGGSSTVASFECALDGADFAPCKARAKFKRLKRGKHTLLARGVNAAGDVDQSPASVTFRVRKRK